MSTLFVLSNMREYGGAEHSIAAILPHLARGRRVVVFVENERHGAALRRLPGAALDVVQLAHGNRPAAWWQSLRLLRARLAQDRPEAILANGHKGALMLFFLRLLGALARTRCAVYVRDFDYYTFRCTLWAMRDFLFFAPSPAIFEHAPYRRWGLLRHRRLPGSYAVGMHWPQWHIQGPGHALLQSGLRRRLLLRIY